MDMGLKEWIWSGNDGYGVERMDMELKGLDMELKEWIWSKKNGYGDERMYMELKGRVWS